MKMHQIDSSEFFTEMVACPICGSNDFVALSSLERNYLNMRTVGCNDCGLVMTNPQPTSQRLEKFYRDEYRFYYQGVHVPNLEYIRQCRKDERAKQTVNFLREQNLLSKDESVLDVGASEGSLLKECKTRNPNVKCIAIEPGATFREFCADYVECETYYSVDAFLNTRQKVDFVIVNHVLEHAKNPIAFLKSVRACLRPEGYIYVDVPCLNDYKNPSMLHLAHMYHFSAGTLSRALDMAGFSVTLIERHSPIMHPPSIRAIARLIPQSTDSQSTWHFGSEDSGWNRLRRINRWGALWLGYHSLITLIRDYGNNCFRALKERSPKMTSCGKTNKSNDP